MAAEYDNFRKRVTKEKESIYGDSLCDTAAQLLPVLDNFDRALSVDNSDFESYKKGVEMIYQGFCETLKKLGVDIENPMEKIHFAMDIIQSFSHEYVFDKHEYIDYDVMREMVNQCVIKMFD